MNLLKKLLIGGVVLAVLCVGAAFFLPRTAHVERSIVIDAPPARVFTVLNGFRQFGNWSPWAEYDPDMKVTYEGPATGVGAKMNWVGNEQVGEGSQEILESTPNSSIKLRLVFGGFDGDFVAFYTLEPEGEGTEVTWGFDADYGNSVLGRYFGLLSDSMLGPDYEKGLTKLKTFIESLPAADFSSLTFESVETQAMPIVYYEGAKSAPDSYAIGVALAVAYSRLSAFMSANGQKQVAPPLATYHGIENGVMRLDAAIPVDRIDVASVGNVHTGHTPQGRAIRVVYRGPYAGLIAAHEQVRAYLAAAGLVQDGPLWEQYMSDPGATPEAELVTHIYYPVK